MHTPITVTAATLREIETSPSAQMPGPFVVRNTRTGEAGPTCKTYVGARRAWYRRGGRAAGWRIFDATGNNVSP